MSRLRVLYLQSTSEIGGSDVSLSRIIESLDKTRFHPHVVLPSDGPLVEKLKEHGCEVILLPEMLKLTTRKGKGYLLRFLLNYPNAVRKIFNIIRANQIDLVHTNDLHNLYGFLAAWLARRAHVWHVRVIVVQSELLRRVELFLARHFADRVVVTSNAVAEMFANGTGVLPSHLVKISNGVSVERYHPSNDGQQVFADLGIGPDVPLVGIVCRLDQWKGVDTFLQAAAICGQEFPHARYVVVGGPIEGQGAYAEELMRMSEALGLKDVVHFTGWRYQPADMPKVYAALSVLVLASSWPEPFGLVLLEAMATGRPVVATNHGGPTEICVEGETGFLVPPRNPEKMAEAILALLRHPEQARTMGAAGRKRVEQLYDQRKCVRKLEALYDEILNSHSHKKAQVAQKGELKRRDDLA
jgi:glycosyltransferase involved in cell wall biosynthesis